MNTLKIIAVIIAVFLGLTAMIVGLLAYGIFSLGDAVVEEANKPVIQKVERVDGEVIITVPLHKVYGLHYENIGAPCEPADQRGVFQSVIVPGEGSNYIYDGNQRVLTIRLANPKSVPSYIYIYLNDAFGACQKSELMTKGHYQIIGYESKIEMTDALKAQMGVVAEDYAVKFGSSRNVMSWQIMGTRKISFNYDEPMLGDVLIINEREKATIRFE